MDRDDLTAILLLILLSIAFAVLTGCTSLFPLPGIDTGKGIFSAPRPPAVPQSDYIHP